MSDDFARKVHRAINAHFHVDSAAWNCLDVSDIAEDHAAKPFSSVEDAVRYYAKVELDLPFSPFAYRDADCNVYRDASPIRPKFRHLYD